MMTRSILMGLTTCSLLAFGCGGDDDASESEAEAEAESEGESEPECTIDDDCEDDNLCTDDVCDGVGGCTNDPIGNLTENPEAAIPDAGTVSDTTTATEVLMVSGLVVELDIDHTYVGDLIITVEHLGLTSTLLYLPDDGLAGNGMALDGIYSFADGGAAFPEDVGGTVPAAVYAPYSPLSKFDGDMLNGVWTITISDNFANDVGTLHSWTLHFEIACDDGDACTSGDTCDAGVCEPGPNAC